VAAPDRISRDGTSGPDWDDVREYIAYLEGISHRGVRLLIKPEENLSNRWGYRVELWLDGLPVALASIGIGRGYAAGARTMAGASYQACLRGQEALELAADVKIIVRRARQRKRS